MPEKALPASFASAATFLASRGEVILLPRAISSVGDSRRFPVALIAPPSESDLATALERFQRAVLGDTVAKGERGLAKTFELAARAQIGLRPVPPRHWYDPKRPGASGGRVFPWDELLAYG